MKKRYSQEQIIYALKQSELGETAAEICRKMGVSEATFYNWKKRYKGYGRSRASPPEDFGGGEQSVKAVGC